jgi:hypothetical protein
VRLASPVLVTLGIVALFACGHMDQDELDCEEAVSVLKDCCPGFDTSPVQCIHASNGCGAGTSPALSQDDSACIRAESCGKLVSTGVCARAQAARACTFGGNDPSTGSPSGSTCAQPAVCP